MSETDLALEYEILKCFKTLLNHEAGADDAIAHPACITNLVQALISPNLQSRKTAAEIVVFLAHWAKPTGHEYVLGGLDHLQRVRGEVGRFDAWFAALVATIDGRGRMGSLVGASEEIRMHSLRGGKDAQGRLQASAAAADNALMEYALTNFLLINTLLVIPGDFTVRMHLRSQMEAAGVKQLIAKVAAFRHNLLDRQIEQYRDSADKDAEGMRETYKHELLRDLADPHDLFNALLASVDPQPRARAFLVSTLQHMLLIRHPGDARVHYFGLIDRLVASIALDGEALDNDFSSLLGVSVATLAARFADHDRLQASLDESAGLRSTVAHLKLEHQALADELGQRDDGLVGSLKGKLTRTEDDLRVSRMTTRSLETRLEELATAHKAALAEMELQNREMFSMLKQARALETIQDDVGVLDRRELMSLWDKKLERTKSRMALEGRGQTDRLGLPVELSSRSPKASDGSRSPRRSAFEDPDEEVVRQHIEERLASGAADLVRRAILRSR